LGDEAGATAQYEAIRQLDPNDVNALQNLSRVYTRDQDWNRAVEVLQALAALEPQEFRHPLAIADILQQVGQPENALVFAQAALELAPEAQKSDIAALIESLTGD
jgi:tetratricopeptide (TPR) repeat protein